MWTILEYMLTDFHIKSKHSHNFLGDNARDPISVSGSVLKGIVLLVSWWFLEAYNHLPSSCGPGFHVFITQCQHYDQWLNWDEFDDRGLKIEDLEFYGFTSWK